jgi:hypothetical protein
MRAYGRLRAADIITHRTTLNIPHIPGHATTTHTQQGLTPSSSLGTVATTADVRDVSEEQGVAVLEHVPPLSATVWLSAGHATRAHYLAARDRCPMEARRRRGWVLARPLPATEERARWGCVKQYFRCKTMCEMRCMNQPHTWCLLSIAEGRVKDDHLLACCIRQRPGVATGHCPCPHTPHCRQHVASHPRDFEPFFPRTRTRIRKKGVLTFRFRSTSLNSSCQTHCVPSSQAKTRSSVGGRTAVGTPAPRPLRCTPNESGRHKS